MQTNVKKWGNSAAVRIPASVMTAARLALNDAVDVREEDGRIIIEPVPAGVWELPTLLAGITAENLHAEVDTGPAMGHEVW